jgi:hypothetical protein
MRPQRRGDSLQVLLDGWISTGTRLAGLVGLGYETFVDKLKNPTALLVFGALATAKDVLQYRQIVREGSLPSEEEDAGQEAAEPRRQRRR